MVVVLRNGTMGIHPEIVLKPEREETGNLLRVPVCRCYYCKQLLKEAGEGGGRRGEWGKRVGIDSQSQPGELCTSHSRIFVCALTTDLLFAVRWNPPPAKRRLARSTTAEESR